MKLDDQLKQYPEEFTLALEYAKNLQCESVIAAVLKKYGIIDEFDNMDKENKVTMAMFLRNIFIYGFYSGVNFTLDPEEFIKSNEKKEE